MSNVLDVLNKAVSSSRQGFARDELNLVATGVQPPNVRNLHLERIGFQISDNPNIHQRIREDGIKMNRRTYEFLIGSPDLYQYYVHNIFRDIFGLEKLYDYDTPPETIITVPDLLLASVGIDNFRAVMVGQKTKVTYKIVRTVIVKDKETNVVIELQTSEPLPN